MHVVAYAVSFLLFGLAMPLSAGEQPAPRRIAEQDETLKGHKALAVRVDVTGPRARILDADTFRTEIESLLRLNGIPVQPDGHPELALTIDTLVTSPAPYTVYTLNLRFIQTLPLPGSTPSALVRAPTWSKGLFGVSERVDVEQFRRTIKTEVNYFIGSYLTVNPALAKTANPPEPKIRTVTNWSGFLSSQFNNLAHQKLADDQLRALVAAEQQVIECLYRAANEHHAFWYKTAPAGIRQILESWPNQAWHPFRMFGTVAVDACPGSPAVAAKLLRDGRIPEK